VPSSSLCEIAAYSPTTEIPWIAAGDGVCGYSGDGVLSQGAEIQDTVGGYAFDKAGDMYFADTGNNVLRRIDAVTGVIHTVAGDNALGAGYSGDGTPATQATLNSPWGIAVDSNGIIYTASYSAGATGITPQAVLARKHSDHTGAGVKTGANITNPTTPDAAIRKIGPDGQIIFPEWEVGSSTPASSILLTNVGNDDLIVANQVLGGANPGDFTADPASTTCNWTTPLPSGQSCHLGFTFTPTAAGVRSATVTLADNTAAYQHFILLSGAASTSTTLIPTVTVTSPLSNSLFPSGTPIRLAGIITNGNPAPYGPTGNAVFSPIFVGGTGNVWAEFTVPISNQGTVSTTVTPPPGIFKTELYYGGDKVSHYNYAYGPKFAVTPVPAEVTATSPTSGQVFKYGSTINFSAKVESAILSSLGINSPLNGKFSIALTDTTSNSGEGAFGYSSSTNTGEETFTATSNGFVVGSYTAAMSYAGDTGANPQNGAGSVTIPFSIVAATPTINWPTPASVLAGTKLGPTQLDATATLNGSMIGGTFVYNPPAGTVLEAGTVTLNTTFTPTDKTDIATATGSVKITVTLPVVKPATITKLSSLSNPAKLGNPVEVKATVSSGAAETTPSGTVTVYEGGVRLTSAKLSGGIATMSITGLTAGTHLLTAEYSGDPGHEASTSAPLALKVVSSGPAPDPIGHKE
jgi:hypothetical protein